MELPRPSTIAWGLVPVAVYAYDKYAPSGEMMSERFDEWMDHPVKRAIAAGVLGTVALHLVNAVPEKWDWIAHVLPPKERPDSV
jgi:hypothetical protein